MKQINSILSKEQVKSNRQAVYEQAQVNNLDLIWSLSQAVCERSHLKP